MKKQWKVLTAVLCSAAISLNTMSYLNAEISQDRIDYKGIPIVGPNVDGVNYFPDAKFQKYLTDKVDGDGNGYLSDTEIDAIKEINLNGTDYAGIASIEGIEVFANLEKFICENVNATNLELKFSDLDHTNTHNYSNVNAKLKYVSCNHSNVKSINLIGCPKVTYLNCSDNYNLDTLNLSENPKLEYLYCSNTKLTAPDLKKNTELKVLDCSYKEDTNRSSELGVFNPTTSNSPALTNLDLTENAKLEYLDCSGNTTLTKLTLASNFDDTLYLKGNSLEYIDCHDCGLTSLDLTYGTVLQYLNCSKNPSLSSLDVSKNTKLEQLNCSESGNLATLTLGNDSVLRTLNCSKTKVASLDLTNILTLEKLNCAETELTALDLSKNTALESLLCEERIIDGANSNLTLTPMKWVYVDGVSSKIEDLKLNRLLYKKAGLSFNEIFENMDSKNEITIDYNVDEKGNKISTNVDIYYTGNALDVMNVTAKDITKPATFKENGTERKITYTNLDGTIANLTAPEKKGDYTLARTTHLFKDVNRISVINGEPIIVYSNGVSQRVTVDDGTSITKNTKQSIVYTNIAPSYKVNENGKAGMGKVVVGITDSAQIPTVGTNNRIEGTSTVATAKIKNGQITINASNNAENGTVAYLWIIDTGSNGTYECCPINILAAPKKLEVRNEDDKDGDPQLKDATRMIGEELEVCIAGYTDAAKTQTKRTYDCTYSYTVPEAVKDCVEITKKPGYDDRFIIKAKQVNDNKDTKVNITFKCDQNKQKIKFVFKVSAAPLGNSTTP